MSLKLYQKLMTVLKVAADGVAAGFGLLVALMYGGIMSDLEPGQIGAGVLAVLTVQLLIFWWAKLYRPEISFLNFEETSKLVKAVSLNQIFVWLGGAIVLGRFVLDESLVGLVLLSGGITLVMALLERHVFYKLAKRNHQQGKWVKRVVIYDVCDTSKMIFKKLEESPQLGLKVIGFIDEKIKAGTLVKTNSSQIANQAPVLGKLSQLRRISLEQEIELLLIATPALKKGDMRRLQQQCEKIGLAYRFTPNLLEAPLYRAEIDVFGGIPFIKESQYRIRRLTAGIKRMIDIVGSLSALVVLAPAFIAIAIAIRATSKGPVIFKQKRVGYQGRPFVMYKFRTMRVNTKKYNYSPEERCDKRITPIGRYLRRTSLDELPQFWNVLKGEMSIVGPRPEMEFIVKKYNSLHKKRLLVKPGITGVWQVSADREKMIHENIDYDIFYINNMSILLDVLVIIRTFWFAIKGVGAI